METIELRSNLHRVIDRIQNEELLQMIYDILKTRENSKTGKLWASLNTDQKSELMASYDESEDKNNLLTNKDVLG